MRSFLQSGPRRLRKVAEHEYKQALYEFCGKFGKKVEMRVPRSITKQITFIKIKPELVDWENVDLKITTYEQHEIQITLSFIHWKWNEAIPFATGTY